MGVHGALLVTTFLIATCGLVYELLAGALASYLLGDSVTQFSLVIGIYLFSMGVGASLSRWIGPGVVRRFVEVEILVGLVGGCSTTVLFAAFPYAAGFRVLLYLFVFLVGTLVGLEIPLLMRILKDRLKFEELVAQVLTMDYIGALIASILFPLVLVPRLGLVRTAFVFGTANALVALWTTRILRNELRAARLLAAESVLAALFLATGAVFAPHITRTAEDGIYADEPILARSSSYQRIVVTRRNDDVRLHLNGHLQFSSLDEYRYHEALVHPALGTAARRRRVLVLGGGDGLAVREVLRHGDVASVTLVDLDAEVTRLFSTHPVLVPLNGAALRDPRVRVVNADAFPWLEATGERFDAAIVDFPDPSTYAVGKLYTTAFFRLLRSRLSPGATVSVQSTSPLFARGSFWCIVATVRAAGFFAAPYHVYVPSFGEWGFVLLSEAPVTLPPALPRGLRFLTAEALPDLFRFPPDMGPVPSEPNRLDTQALVRLYESEWRQIYGEQ